VRRVETRAMPDPLIDTGVSVSDEGVAELQARVADESASYGLVHCARVLVTYSSSGVVRSQPEQQEKTVRGCSSVVRAGDS
jgi:hypothetical protein